MSNLRDTRNRAEVGHESENQALESNIEELEIQLKMDKQSKKRQYLSAGSSAAAESDKGRQPKLEPDEQCLTAAS